jgi:hypothetical protein
MQRACAGYAQQFVIRGRAPKKEGEARGQFQIADRVVAAGLRVRRCVLKAEDELWIGQHRFQRSSNSLVEALAFGTALLVETERPR